MYVHGRLQLRSRYFEHSTNQIAVLATTEMYLSNYILMFNYMTL